jgi:hypothetical protein
MNSSRKVSAAQKGPDGRRIEVQSQGDLVIAEAVAPEHEKFRLTPRKGIQNRPNALLLFSGRVQLFRSAGRGCRADEAEKTFVAGAAGLAPELIKAGAESHAVQPAFDVISLRAALSPQFQEDLHGQLLGARGVANDPRNHASHAAVMRAEQRVDIELCLPRSHLHEGFARCIHNRHNDAPRRIVTEIRPAT